MGRIKWSLLSILVLFLASFLVGCLKTDTVDTNEPKVLRVLASQYDFERFSALFEVTFDHVEIEMIDLEKEMRQLYADMNEGKQVDFLGEYLNILNGPNAPDVILFEHELLPLLIDHGQLTPLDSFIENSNFDLDNIAPIVRDGIRDLGNGTLYALTPTYRSSALFYNKDAFDKLQIPYPDEGLSWDQLSDLAAQLTYESDGEKKYGLTFEGGGESFYLMQEYLTQLDVTLFDADLKTFTADQPVIERAWNYFIDLSNREVVAPPFDFEKAWESGRRVSPFDHDAFTGGRAAMTIASYNYVRSLEQRMNYRDYGPDIEVPDPFSWDVAVLPTHPEAPDVGFGITYRNLMAINAKAENLDFAWQFISFSNSEKVAKILARDQWLMVSRTELNQTPEGATINLEAFSTLKPTVNQQNIDFELKFPNGGIWSILSVGRTEFDAALKREKSVKEALAEYQRQGQERLDQLNKELEERQNSENGNVDGK